MFEVGKKYRRKTEHNKVVEVLFVTDLGTALVRYVKGAIELAGLGIEHAFQKSAFEFWEEYVEPVSIVDEQFVYIERIHGENKLLTLGHAWNRGPKVGKIRMTYVEGSGLSVEVIEGGDPTLV